MKDVGIGIVGFVLYIVLAIGVPIAIIGGGIWFYNDVIKDEPTAVYDDVEVKVEKDFNERYANTISPAEENAFMSECTKEGSYSYCQCTFNYLDARLTPTEFRQLGENIDNEIPEIMWDAVAACIDQYN